MTELEHVKIERIRFLLSEMDLEQDYDFTLRYEAERALDDLEQLLISR